MATNKPARCAQPPRKAPGARPRVAGAQHALSHLADGPRPEASTPARRPSTQHPGVDALRVARVYLRVSTDEQDLRRQEAVQHDARAAGYYVANVYREKGSGATADRPELQRMIADLQPGETVIAERIDRLSRLPLQEAERLVAAIKDKGARLAIPGIVDLSELAAASKGTARIVLEAVQDMLLKVALQAARDDYEDRRLRQRQGIDLAKAKGDVYKGRPVNKKMHARVIELRTAGRSIKATADELECSTAQVKRIWAAHKRAAATGASSAP